MAVLRLAHFLALIIYFAEDVISQTSKSVPDSPCRRFGHRAIAIKDTLYVDGGWTYADQLSITPDKTINRNVLLNNLSQVTADSPSMPQQYKSFQKSDDVPSVIGGVLWADEVNEIIWLYGGEYDVNPKKDFQLWGFDTRLNQWNLSNNPSIASSDIKRTSYGAGATLPGKGYYYGGYQNSKTVPSWTGSPTTSNGLVEYDMQTGKIRGLRAYSDGLGMAEGAMVAIPASAAGMLLYFGGVSSTNGNSTEVALDMTQILIYDIGDNSWFAQTATGDIPANRRKFCAGVTAAQDASSYNVYIYGGFGFGVNASGFDDVYILSLPTFTWVKWASMSYDPKIGNPHGDLTCNMVGSNQMIVMGGNFTAASADFCDVPKQYNQHNLVLGSENESENGWNPYSPTKRQSKYFIPKLVTNITGGSSTGSATNTRPAHWSNDNLAKYFSQTATFAHRTPTRTAPVSAKRSSRPHVGAIAGGTVGGGVILTILVVLLWRCCVKKRRQTTADESLTRNVRHGVVSEMNADPDRFSKGPAAFSTAAESNHHLQGQQMFAYTSSPALPHPHEPNSPVQLGSRPISTQQQSYGPTSPYQQQQYVTISAELPSGVPPNPPSTQTYNYPRPETQKMSPSRPHELDARGPTPGTHHVKQSTSSKGYHAGAESISNKIGGDARSDSTSQSTQSPKTSSWKN